MMTHDFSAAMRRATEALRNGNMTDATRMIQDALGGRHGAPAPAADIPLRRKKDQTQDIPDAEIVEEAPPPRTLFDRLRAQMGRECMGPSDLPSMPIGRGGTQQQVPVPEGAQFLSRSHGGPHGMRNYRLYIPSCGAHQVQGLVVMLHGCKQNPEDFALGTGMNAAAEAARLAVAWPEQPMSANISACWNWFEPSHQKSETGEPAILASLTQDLVAEFHLSREQTFVAGLSAGGAMAAILAETHPDLFGAVGIHSGLPAGAAHDAMSAFAAMGGRGGAAGRPTLTSGSPRLIVFHGDADQTVAPGNAKRIMGRIPKGSRKEEGRSAGGQRFVRTIISDAAGRTRAESWTIEGAGHAWFGGTNAGSYTDPAGPDASGEMIRFFLDT